MLLYLRPDVIQRLKKRSIDEGRPAYLMVETLLEEFLSKNPEHGSHSEDPDASAREAPDGCV